MSRPACRPAPLGSRHIRRLNRRRPCHRKPKGRVGWGHRSGTTSELRQFRSLAALLLQRVEIDFDGILDRIERIRIPDSFERSLIWGKDGKIKVEFKR